LFFDKWIECLEDLILFESYLYGEDGGGFFKLQNVIYVLRIGLANTGFENQNCFYLRVKY